MVRNAIDQPQLAALDAAFDRIPPHEPGERRIVILRYGPLWAAVGRTRFGYEYSAALLQRLTPARRRILDPIPPARPSAAVIPSEKPADEDRR